MYLVKETVEAEELDDRDEEDEDEAVPVESESYVNLRKKMVNKHNLKIDNIVQENGKLCRDFQRKRVKENCFFIYNVYTVYCYELQNSCHASFLPVIEAFQVHAGAEEESASLARKREHSRPVGSLSGAGGQRDDRVGPTEQHNVDTFTKTL